ncbi:MAG: AI-2E family transporter [Peptococcaceae bacterium]|nr:AI-2E family transporter [Peptococcaceae bacterium]
MQGRKILLYGLLILILLVVVWLVIDLRRVLQPLFWGACLAYLIYPLVVYLTNKKIPLGLSILLIYLGIGALVAFSIVWAIPRLLGEMESFLELIPQYILAAKAVWQSIFEKLPVGLLPQSVQDVFEQFHGNIEASLMNGINKATEKLLSLLRNLFSAALAPIFAYYFVKDRELISKKIQAYLPPKWRQKSFVLFQEINVLLRQFLQGYLMVSLLVGVLSVIGYSLVGMPYGFALGVLAGLLDLIPYFGPFIAAVPAVLLALMEGKRMFFAVLFVCLGVQQIENLASPKIIGEKIGLHPVFILLAVLIGGYWFGVPGMILAVPVFAVLGKVFSLLYGEKVAYEKYLPENEKCDKV